MIYNRTYIDIINARKIYYNKIQNRIELTADEQTTIDRAFFNLTAINRITSKIKDIWQAIIDFGGTKIENADVREWNEQEIFTASNFSNIRQNIADIIDQLTVVPNIDISAFESSYNALNDEYSYTNLNNLEKLLYDIEFALSVFVIEAENIIYIIGAYNATLSEGVLTIE